jgi:hypothetical protein
MTLLRFMNYVWFSTDCPFDVSPERWKGMLRFWELNKHLYIIE